MSCNTVPSVCDIASEYDLANSSSLQDDDISPLSGSVISLALPDSQSDGKERPAQDEARQKATFSTWTIGWRTSLIMFALYLFSFLVVLTHFLLLKFLNGRLADSDHSIPQSYAAAASHLLASIFRASLCASLSVAFTQHLWRVLRSESLKLATIERLYNIRQNFLLLAFPGVFRATQVLFTLALFSWIIPLAVIYPPGALIVVPAPILQFQNMTVQTFDPNHSINMSAPIPISNLANYENTTYLGSQLQARWVSKLALQSGQIAATSSPCGNNCTFVTRFIGPSLECNKTVFNVTVPLPSSGIVDHYSGSWDGSIFDVPIYASDTLFRFKTFSINVYRPYALYESKTSSSSHMLVSQARRISCSAGRASYTLNTTYTNGIRSLTHSSQHLGSLDDVASQGVPLAATNVTEHEVEDKYSVGQAMNLFALFDSMFDPLAGTYPARAFFRDRNISSSKPLDTAIIDGTSVTLYPADFNFYNPGPGSGRLYGVIEPNNTIIAETRFNLNHNNFTAIGPNLAITQKDLNEALTNITLSIMYTYDEWKTRTTVTMTMYSNIYSFSSIYNLVIPYITCLILALPFLLLGAYSLHKNGVPAIDGGFLQVLTTTTGSKRLEVAAARGCLGGDENMPKELLEMKIRFGELIGDEEESVKRAGFGTEDEVVPLRRRETYGIQVA